MIRTKVLPPNQVVSQAVRLAEAARPFAFPFGHDELADADVAALLRACDTDVAVVEMEEHWVTVPDERGRLTLYLRAGDAPTVHLYCKLVHVGAYWPRAKSRSLWAAGVFALTGIFHASGCRSADAGEWARALSSDLRNASSLWESHTFNEHVALVEKVLNRLDRDADSEGEVKARARRIFTRARGLRLARDFRAAESMYLRGFRMANRAGDYRYAVRCLMGAAQCAGKLGALPRADALFARAERVAVRHECRRERAWALHDWFVLHCEYGNGRRADDLARRAEAAYPRSDDLTRLAHDIGWFWLMEGDHHAAVRPLRAALERFVEPRDKMLALGNLARAAGALGDAAEFDQSHERIRALALEPDTDEAYPQCMLSISYGAAHLGRFADAEAAALRALDLAVAGEMHKLAFEAESHLVRVKAQRADAMQHRPVRDECERRALAERLCARLAR